MGVHSQATSIILVRAWTEDHPTARLRAVVTAIADVGNGRAETSVTTASIDEVCELVRAALTDLLQR